jgi:formamidopyrimidine-DNA glycosylase
MPELPEVEAARRLLEEHCVGTTISGCVPTESGGGPRTGMFDDIVFDDEGSSPQSVLKHTVGKELVAVRRCGKQLLLQFASPPHLLAHFGMTGAFAIRGVAPLKFKAFSVKDAEWPPRFTKCELTFSGEMRLAFTDPRRLGRLRFRTDPESQAPWSTLAPDPLLEPITVEAMKACLARKGTPIKALLLDQNELVSGVGNWVADEVLFHAGIHPEASCHTLSDAQVSRLHASLLHVVRVAVDANADSDSFPKEWLFHVRCYTRSPQSPWRSAQLARV